MLPGKTVGVGAAFITSAFRIRPPLVYPERGRDECCPYTGRFKLERHSLQVLNHFVE